MRPYYDADGITIYHGDVLDVLDAGAVPQADAIIADPPYCSGGRQQASAREVFSKNGDRADWFLSDNMGTDTYLWWLRQVGQRLLRLAPLGAHFYCFTDWRQYPTVVTSFESVGWTLRSCVVWDKMRGGAMGSFWRNDHELIPVFSKGPPRPLPHGGFFNVLHHVKVQGDPHPTIKPIEVVRALVEASGASLVLDPFMGTGTTLRAAKDLGRCAIGIEVEERWCAEAARRLGQGVLDLAGAV